MQTRWNTKYGTITNNIFFPLFSNFLRYSQERKNILNTINSRPSPACYCRVIRHPCSHKTSLEVIFRKIIGLDFFLFGFCIIQFQSANASRLFFFFSIPGDEKSFPDLMKVEIIIISSANTFGHKFQECNNLSISCWFQWGLPNIVGVMKTVLSSPC